MRSPPARQFEESSLQDVDDLFAQLEHDRGHTGHLPPPTWAQLIGIIAWLLLDDLRNTPAIGWVVAAAVFSAVGAYVLMP